ncbi:MAG: Gldg family protein [Treponema sp.]|nr:Gldg family protein [Treponema sp.]
MTAVLKREFNAYFYTPLGYVFIGAYWLFTGFFFFNYNLYGNSSDLRLLFGILFTVTLFLVPILTMRLLSEDRKMRTDMIYRMSPVSGAAVIAGKYLAALCVYLLAMSGVLAVSLVVEAVSEAEWSVIAGHFTGLFLLGAVLISVGLFISALTENQIIAAVGGYCVGFLLMLLDGVAVIMADASNNSLAGALKVLSLRTRYEYFTLGILGIDHVVFFISLSAFFVFLTVTRFEKGRRPGRRRMVLPGTSGGGIAASILFAAAFVCVLNGVFLLLARRFPALSVDLTSGQIFKLSEGTVEYIGGLQREVTIHVLAREETFAGTSPYNAQANEVFKQFEKKGPRISLVYVDYVRNPAFASSYPGLIMKHGDVLVSAAGEAEETGGRHSLVKTEELFNYARGRQGELSIVSSRAEEAIYTAILSITSDEPVRAAFITGHAEYTMDAFAALLGKNNYETSSWNLMRGRIDPRTDIILIIAPREDFTTEELERLDDFLINGGSYGKTLFYCADPSQPPLERIAVFLREWGVAVEDGAVFETDETRVYNYQPFYAMADYAEEAYSGRLLTASKPMLAPVSRPLRVLFDYRNNYSVKTLLEFGPSAGVRPPEAPETFTAADAALRGPFPALTLSRYSVIDRETGAAEKVSSVLTAGSAAMLDTLTVDNPAFANAEYLVNLLNRLSGRRDIIPLRPKSFTGQGLNLPRFTVNALGLMFIFLIPAAVLIAGLAVWMRRRRA